MNLVMERLKVFLTVVGSIVIVGLGLYLVDNQIVVPSETLANHIEADRVFHDSIVLPMIGEMRENVEEQLLIARQILRIQCLDVHADTEFEQDSIFVEKCKDVGAIAH